MRSLCPVAHSGRYAGSWVVTRYNDTQGHGVCAAPRPALFDCDDLGYGVVVGDGVVVPSPELDLVISNCPEQAIAVASE
jgi:ferredoxin